MLSAVPVVVKPLFEAVAATVGDLVAVVVGAVGLKGFAAHRLFDAASLAAVRPIHETGKVHSSIAAGVVFAVAPLHFVAVDLANVGVVALLDSAAVYGGWKPFATTC